MKANKISDKSRLIKRFLEDRQCDDYKAALGKKGRGRGIYVLYCGQKVYYIGLSKSSLRSRLRKHANQDRHKGKWDRFSFYQIGKTRYIKDVESLLIRVCKPPGNCNSGKFNRRYNLNLKSKRK